MRYGTKVLFSDFMSTLYSSSSPFRPSFVIRTFDLSSPALANKDSQRHHPEDIPKWIGILLKKFTGMTCVQEKEGEDEG